MTPRRALEIVHVPLLVAVSALLALGAALGDSATIDEPGHLAAGLAVWHAGDYRLSPDHPPLARLWAALPVSLSPHVWPGPHAPGWSDGNFFQFGRALFARNDPERLLLPARAMSIVLLGATCLATWWTTRALFGRGAAALALLLVAFDPAFLAHGHYVTTDVPLALTALLAVVTCARLFVALTPARLAAAAAALGALFLSKLTSLLVLPALGAMALVAVLRRQGLALHVPGLAARVLTSRVQRCAALGVTGMLLVVALWATIWAAYGFRYQALQGADAEQATMYPGPLFGPPAPANMDEAWDLLLREPRAGRARDGLLPRAVRRARGFRLLPEAYLFGLAALGRHSLERVSYLQGEIYPGGRLAYFPLTFVWKTPVATLLLLTLGVAALAWGRLRSADGLLGLGLLVFCATYLGASLLAGLNIGQRHLLPLYPTVFALAGGAWAWADARAGRLVIGVLAASLIASTLWAYPGFLGYFNEAAGGWRAGYRRLADSNVDWSQDLLRLRDWMQRHPGEAVALQQSGHAPWPRGLAARPLLAREPGEQAAPFAPGVYVVSTNELVGLFKPYQRASTWRDPRLRATYAALWTDGRFASPQAQESFDALRRALLVSRLAARPADERIGTSLLLYRLSETELDALTRP